MQIAGPTLVYVWAKSGKRHSWAGMPGIKQSSFFLHGVFVTEQTAGNSAAIDTVIQHDIIPGMFGLGNCRTAVTGRP